MIDNIEFTKFVLANEEMSEEEKRIFLEAVPKMTEEEKIQTIFSIRAQEVAEVLDKLDEREVSALFSGEDVEEAAEKFLSEHGQEVDQKKIEQIRANLKAQIENNSKIEETPAS